MSRLLIAGTNSGCGKTTVTCALLSALTARGLSITAFKCGPDYIDPMFHREASGIASYNLDSFFCDESELRAHLARRAGRDISVIEGVMGYYDGIAYTDRASAYETARLTETPAVLVADVRGMANSAAALLEGFINHRQDSRIKGVIFNGITEPRYADMARTARSAGIEPLGYMPFDVSNSIGSRHLGLITAAEIADICERLARLGESAERTLDIDGLIALAHTAPPLTAEKQGEVKKYSGLRIAVARDKAFCFLYAENLELLREYGCELMEFSPLDGELPPDIHALYLCGGYPELYARELSERTKLLDGIKDAVAAGLPTIAECGGFMLLHKALDGYPLVGVIPASVYKTQKLQRFGYITMTAERDNLLCPKGGEIRAHEFHYWDSDSPGADFTARKAGRDTSYPCVHATNTLYAGFPHIYFDERIVKSFLEKVEAYANRENHSGNQGD